MITARGVVRRLAALTGVALLLAGCSDDGLLSTDMQFDRVVMVALPSELESGASLPVSVVGSNGTHQITITQSRYSIRWVSSDPSIIRIEGDGDAVTLRAVAPGRARVTVEVTPLAAGTQSAGTGIYRVSADVLSTQVPTDFLLVSPDNQTGIAGALLPDSVSVKIVDKNGSGVPGIGVNFEVLEGAGALSHTTTVTSTDGFARTSWRLGQPGLNKIRAKSDRVGRQVEVTANGITPVATQLVIVSGNFQQGVASTSLTNKVAVRVRDASSTPLSGIQVNWSAIAGGGSLAPQSSTTDGNGVSSVNWILGTTAGSQTARATVGTMMVDFGATAIAGAAAQVAKVSGDIQSAVVNMRLTDSLVVRVTDQFGNAVSGAQVAWSVQSGGGGISPTTSITNTNGLARAAWAMGSTAGPATAKASVAGDEEIFTANATASTSPTSITIVKIAGDAQSATIGTRLADSLAVKIQNAQGVGIAGATVTFTVTLGGGSMSPSTRITDANGIARAAWTLGSAVGGGAVSASTPNATPATFSSTAIAPSVTQVVVTPSVDTISALNAQITLTATGRDINNQLVPSARFIWSSLSPTIATVDSMGRVTGLAVGRALIIAATAVCCSGADTASVEVLAPAPTLSRVDLTPASASMQVGQGRQFSALGVMSDGSSTVIPLTWSATGGTVTSSGSYAAGTVPGTYRVIAQAANGMSDTSAVTITALPAPTLTSLDLTPSSTSLQFGQTQQFAALGTMSDGSTATVAITWTATGGTVSSTGLYTAGNTAGAYRVIAQAANGVADTSAVTVVAPTIVGLSVLPSSVSVLPAGTQQFTVSATMSNSTTQNSPSVTWSATGGSITPAGLYTAGTTSGSFRVIAATGGVADTSNVTVTTAPAPSLVSVVLTPASAALQYGQTQQFGAVGLMSDGTSNTIGITWSATGGTVSTSGLYAAGSTAGAFRVIAQASNGMADTSAVTITAPTITSVTMLPATASLTSGQTQQFTVTAAMSNGTTQTPIVTWTATGGTITTGGLYTAGGTAGTFRAIATAANGAADTSSITITATAQPSIVSLALGPKTWTLVPGEGQYFIATATLSNGTTTTTPSVTWTATGGTFLFPGFYQAGSVGGTHKVIATAANGVADTATVTISGGVTIVSMAVSPKPVALQTGQTQQFTVSSTMSDGSTQTPSVTWSATGGTVTSAGIYTAGSTAGVFRVIATASAKADTSAVTITAVPTLPLARVNLTPASASLQFSQVQQFNAVGVLSDGSSATIPITWTATGGTVNSAGLYTSGNTAGAFRVIATASNGMADTSAITLTAPTVTGLTISPKPVSMQVSQIQQFTVSATLSNGTTQSNPSVTWSATGGTIIGGLYTAGLSTGSFKVIATGSGRADTANVTVQAASSNNMFFNSAEAGCGSDANILMCDDFEDGSWYSKNCDVANASGGLLQTDGWCGTIYRDDLLTAGTVRCGSAGVNSSCAATTGVFSYAGNMADHALSQAVNEVWVRFYTKPLSGYVFGAEKMLTFNDGNPGDAGIKWGNLSWNCGGNASSTGWITMGFPPPEDVCQTQNTGNDITITSGNWYYYEVHLKLSDPGQANGIFELWVDNCGGSGNTCPATPTLRMRRTNIRSNRSSSSELIRVLWFESWSNPQSSGERLWDQIKVSKAGPIGR